MSDEGPAVSKRGRKPAANADKGAEKLENKKRQRKEMKQNDSGDEDVVLPKRGRGRPKGTIKKKAAPKPKGKVAGRRGRPKKDKVDDSGEENEENDEDDEADEDDE